MVQHYRFDGSADKQIGVDEIIQPHQPRATGLNGEFSHKNPPSVVNKFTLPQRSAMAERCPVLIKWRKGASLASSSPTVRSK